MIVILYEPAHNIVSRICCLRPPLTEFFRHVFKSKIGTVAALKAPAID